MKNTFFFFILLILCIACQPKNNQISQYFDNSDRDTLLTNIITYIYNKAPYATNKTRFEPPYRKFYVENLPKFSFQNYYIDKDSTHYFFLIRPVGNSKIYKRGVLGKFHLKSGSLMPENFEEIVNTPHLPEEVVKERGAFLFQELIKNKQLDKYLGMKHYIEWPDSTLVYDKNINEWVGRNQISKDSIQ